MAKLLPEAMPRTSVTFRPSRAAAEWLDRQRRERRIPLTTLCQMALDEHIRRHEARLRAEARMAASAPVEASSAGADAK